METGAHEKTRQDTLADAFKSPPPKFHSTPGKLLKFYQKLLRRYVTLRQKTREYRHHLSLSAAIIERQRETIAEEKMRRIQIEEKQLFDPKLGILNYEVGCKTRMEDIFKRVSKHALHSDVVVTVCLGDLDNFGAINKEYLNATGDELLGKVVDVFEAMFNRKTDFIVRRNSTQGDEILVIVVTFLKDPRQLRAKFRRRVRESPESFDERRHATSVEECRLRTEMVREAIHAVEIRGYEKIKLSGTFGIYSFINLPQTFEEFWIQFNEAVNKADQAMQRGKKKGKDILVLDPEIHSMIERRRQLRSQK